MACDFSVSTDLARYGQAGPKHGSAPIGGATDFLPVIVGAERAMAACILCEPFSAHKAYQMGILTEIVPALKVDGKYVPNPLVETQRMVDDTSKPGVRVEKRPARRPDGSEVPGLFNAWIWLDNPSQYNSYTTDMVKGVILAMRAASNARDVNCVVFTGVGDKAFCTGGNTKEYAEYYAGQPQEYRQYMRLFNDMVSAILACDFSVAQDLARFGQAGPKHGSAPIGGATDFLPAIVGAERAMAACVLCEPFSAHKAYQMGILTDIVPALKVDGKFVANPTVETQRLFDDFGRNAYGETKTGDALAEGKALMKRGAVDLAMLDARVEELCAKILLTFPDCTTKTLEELRKPKLEAWNRNKEDSRAWLALNMMTEARSGFTAFNEGPKDDREIDFVLLRQKLAAGQSWVGPLHDEIQPGAKTHG